MDATTWVLVSLFFFALLFKYRKYFILRFGSHDAAEHYNQIGNQIFLTTRLGPTLNQGFWKGIKKRDSEAQAQANINMFTKVAKHSKINAADHILDVGCGFGTFCNMLKKEYKANQVTGLNISDHQVDYAKNKYKDIPNMKFVKGSATCMPFDAHSFDKVVSVEAAFHFPTREEFVKEALRVLKPGGRFVMVDVLCPKPTSIWEKIQSFFIQRGVQTPIENFYDIKEFDSKIKAAGFNAIKVKSINKHVRDRSLSI